MLTKSTYAHSRSYPIIITFIISALLLASCGALKSIAPNPPVPTPTVPPSSSLPSPTAEQPPASVIPAVGVPTTSVPQNEPTAIPPSPTPEMPLATATSVLLNPQTLPAATPLISASAGSIAFSAGATATVVQGTLQPGQVATYTLQAGQSQPLVLIMDSPNNDVTLGVFDPNGTTLLNPASKWRSWQMVLPATGLYRIQVTGGALVENFTLTVKVAQLVNFDSGASSITLTGLTAYGYPFDYALTCSGGQTMTASLNVPSSTAYLDIFEGATSNMLLFDSARATSWTGVLSQTQPYVVEVVPNNFQVVNYSLTVSCTGTPSSPAATQTGDIVIKPGSTAAVMHGTVGPGQVVTYTLQASNSQPLVLNVGTVGSTMNDVTLGLIAPDGTSMFDPAKKYLNYQVPLRETGLYTIQLFGGSTTENFELTVKLPRLEYFTNSNSISIKSATEQGFVVSYAIYGNKGETLTASLSVPSTTAYLDIFGMQNGSLLSYQDKDNSWTGVLPKTQIYIIEVIPRGGWIYGYTLTLTRQ